MHYNEFAEQVKRKYPSYANIDNKTLAQEVIKKYPTYAKNVTFDDIVEEPKVPSFIPTMESSEGYLIPVEKQNPVQQIQPSIKPTEAIKPTVLQGHISKVEETPYMKIANNPLLTKEEKAAQIKALHQQEINNAEIQKQEDIKRVAKEKLLQREKQIEKHPILHGILNKYVNPVYDAETNLLQERAEYGTNAPLDVKAKNLAKRGAMGGLTTAANIAAFLPGGREIRAAQIARAGQVAKATKLAKAGQIAKASGLGAVGFGAEELADSTEDFMNNKGTAKDILDRTGRAALTGGVVGATGYGAYGLMNKPVTNIVEKIATDKAYKILAKAQKKGQTWTKEIFDDLVKKEISKLEDNIVSGSLIKGGKALPAAALDTATIATMDYGINKAQGKQELSYPEQLKAYAPLALLGGIPVATHIAGKPTKAALNSKVANTVKDAISKSNKTSNLVGETANALGVKTNINNAKQYQELGNKVKDYDMPAEKHYTSNELNTSEIVANFSKKEKQQYLYYLAKGIDKEEAIRRTQEQANKKFAEFEAKAQEEQNPNFTENIFGKDEKSKFDEMSAKVDNVQNNQSHVEAPASHVEHKVDTNTPIKQETHVNEPASHVNEKVVRKNVTTSQKVPQKNVDNAWIRIADVKRGSVKRLGADKYLDNRFNSYYNNFKGAEKFYNKTSKKINNSKIPSQIKEVMLNQLDEAAERFGNKNNISFSGYKKQNIGNVNTDSKRKAIEFLNNNVASDDIENIKISFKDLSDETPEYKNFLDYGAGDVEVKFSKKHINNCGNGSCTTDGKSIIIHKKESIPHELQHSNDFRTIDAEPDNIDYQITKYANGKINEDFQNYYNTYKTEIDKYFQGEELNEFEQKVVDAFKNEYRYDYYNDIIEKRGNNAKETGKPCERTLQEDINEFKQHHPEKWEEYAKSFRQYDTRRRKTNNNGNVSRRKESYDGIQRVGERATKQERLNIPVEQAKKMREVSKDIETKRIKRGLITPEQAENRKKQILNGVPGEGAYIPMFSGNSPIEDVIDLTRNYNKGRESKVGLYGEAKSKGTPITAEKATENLFIAQVRTNFVDDIATYVEDNFAQPIKDGHVKEGYVAVNGHLLWNGLDGKQSQEWYDLISKGEEAIRKAYPNKEQADFFVELHNRTKEKEFQIPKQVFKKLLSGQGETAKEALQRYGWTGDTVWKHVGSLTDAFTDQFKRTVLGTASFWVNNRFSNHIMLAANSKNPAKHILDLYEAGKIKDKDMPQELLENSILEAVKNSTTRKIYSGYNNFDNIVNLFGGHTLKTKNLKGIKKATAKVGNAIFGFPNKVYNKIANNLLAFNSKFENYERKVALVQQIDKNKKELLKKTGQQVLTTQETLKHLDKHPEMRATIVQQVENVLGDYNNFTATEKKVLKRIVPFYSWYRTVARNTVHMAKNNPARFALIQLELAKLKEDDKDLKEYQRGSFRLPYKDKRSGKQLLINKVNQVPWETLRQFGNEADVKNAVNPLLKVPTEAMLGKKFFGSGEITNKRYISSIAGKNNDGTYRYRYYDTKNKEFIDSLPASTRAGYVGKELGKNFYPILSNRLIGGESLIQGALNYKKNGKFIEPDKLYDADFGGFSHGDIASKELKKNGKGWKSYKRYAASNTSEETKLLNRLGLTLQPEHELSKADKEKLKKATERYKKKRKAS